MNFRLETGTLPFQILKVSFLIHHKPRCLLLSNENRELNFTTNTYVELESSSQKYGPYTSQPCNTIGVTIEENNLNINFIVAFLTFETFKYTMVSVQCIFIYYFFKLPEEGRVMPK